MAERLNRTINISFIAPEVLTRKTFGKTLLIIDGTFTGERLDKYSTYQEVIDGEGSNTEAQRFALSYFNNGAYGTTPEYLWVLKIDITDGSEDLATELGKILDEPEDYYFITCDENFSDAQKKVISDTVEVYTNNWYMVAHEYTDVDAYNDALDTDLSPVLGALNYEKTFINFANKVDGNNQYLTGAVCGFLSGVEYTETRGKNTPAKKSLSGINVVGLSDSNIGNLIDKNYNYYTKTTTILNNDWYGFNARNVNGNSFINQIAVDYMSYNLTVSLAELLKNTPIIGFDRAGLDLIEATLDRDMNRFAIANILSIDGVASDGELFPNGYKIIMPELASITAADKQEEKLRNIVIRFLPKFAITSIDITLQATI